MRSISYNLSKMLLLSYVLFLLGCSSTQNSLQTNYDKSKQNDQLYSWVKLDTIKAGKFDTGKMWTFDFPPTDYFKSEYNFVPTEDWYNNVRMSALRFANYCSASFVSEDGLVMTNHHCARQSITEVTQEGEDLHEHGFIAETLEDERPVPGLYVDQLVLIKDVTKEIQAAIDSGKDEQEKIDNRQKKMKELTSETKKETGLECQVITFYNGGKYSLYGFKRYNDVRLVFAPEEQAGFFGGDPDNFTYPRYNLDCTFFRVYDEDGKPLKTEHYFKWSPNGAAPGEPVFVVGNPGRTNRLFTMAQLEYQRDYQYPITLDMINSLVSIYDETIKEFPDRKFELQDQLFNFTNSQKAFNGILGGLRNPILMQKKRDFEKSFKEAINAKPALKEKYADLWDKIEGTRNEMKQISNKLAAYNLSPFFAAKYFSFAKKMIDIATERKKPADQIKDDYKDENLKATIEKLYAGFDEPMTKKLLAANIKMLTLLLGENNDIVAKFSDSNIKKSSLLNSESAYQFAQKNPDEILKSTDPFIYYVVNTQDEGQKLTSLSREIGAREADFVQRLGRAVFEVYGTSIPPDATFSLRIADGVVKGYNYNGTIAPPITTFYGMYDRYYSHQKEFPFNLPERYLNRPAEFDLETPYNFVSTNDIIGGNSGSPVINKKAEVVGLAFDGNIESLPGQFIFDTEFNRTVNVHSAGMLEVIQDLYKIKRLSEELKHGKIK